MKLFQWFKSMSEDTQNVRKKKEPEPPHPFIEQCRVLKKEFGLMVPPSAIDCLVRFNLPKNHYYYSPFWHFDTDHLELFFTEKFIELTVARYQEIHGKEADLAPLQDLLDETRYEFNLKDDCFDNKIQNSGFINQCYREFKASGEELIITLDFDFQNLVLTTKLAGQVGQNYPGLNTLYRTTAGIRYEELQDYQPLEEIIRKTLNQED
ncbi:hypothetical protein [Chryseobacterium indologenes]|uniref:Uncharacterized protein n=1 Tax=Chryseobacterium indologenes TaxID=253 RepID=A0A0N0ZY39_CHRID|nr:hypothetical protein [Chryseobacterium indologenes]KPE53089.1 hypothetical protein AOB46_03640 [Chryseobacterium indologenes]